MLTNGFLSPFFDALNQRHIRYSVLRNYTHLPLSLNGSDLDILIDKDDLENFYQCLNQVLELTNGKIISQFGKLCPQICILGQFKGSSYGLQIDIFEGILPYKTMTMFPASFILKRSKLHSNIKVTDDDDAAILAFLKEILNNNTCRIEHFTEAQNAWHKNQSIYENTLLEIYNKIIMSLFHDIFSDSFDSNKISNLVSQCRTHLNKGLDQKIENIKSSLNKLYRFFKPPGYCIALLGTDGSGKTAIFNGIKPPLNEAVHNSLYYEHMRPNLIPSISKLLGKPQQTGPNTNPHKTKPSKLTGSLLRLGYYSIDYILGYWIKIFPNTVKKSSIWVFDRYYYDYLMDPKRALINLPSWVIKLVLFFIPKPDLILCLGTDAKIIHARKPELSIDETTRQLDFLRTFCSNEKRAVWIETGSTQEESIEHSLRTIMTHMSNRYK